MEKACRQCGICGVTIGISQEEDNDTPVAISDEVPLSFTGTWLYDVHGFYRDPADGDSEDNNIISIPGGRYYAGVNAASSVHSMYCFPNGTHPASSPKATFINFKRTPLGTYQMSNYPPRVLCHEGYVCHQSCFDILKEVFAVECKVARAQHGTLAWNMSGDIESKRALECLWRLMDQAMYSDVVRGRFGQKVLVPMEFPSPKTKNMKRFHWANPAVTKDQILLPLGIADNPFTCLPRNILKLIAEYMEDKDIHSLSQASTHLFIFQKEYASLLGHNISPMPRLSEAKNTDLFSSLPMEIVVHIICMLGFGDVCSLRKASRAIASIGFPQIFWKARLLDGLDSVMGLAQELVTSRDLDFDWELMYHLMKSYLKGHGGLDAQRLQLSLGNRQRIWNICRSISCQIIAINDAIPHGYHQNPMLQTGVDFYMVIQSFTTLSAVTFARGAWANQGRGNYDTQYATADSSADILGMYVSWICINNHRFVSGLRFVFGSQEEGKVKGGDVREGHNYQAVGYIHQRNESFLQFQSGGDEPHSVRFVLSDQGVKAVGIPSRRRGENSQESFTWAGGYSGLANDTDESISVVDICLKNLMLIELKLDLLKIVCATFLMNRPYFLTEQKRLNPKKLHTWAPTVPAPELFDVEESQYFAPKKCHNHYSPLATVVFNHLDVNEADGYLEGITAYVGHRQGMVAMRFDFSKGTSRYWGSKSRDGLALTFFLDGKRGEEIVAVVVVYTHTQVMEQIDKIQLITNFGRCGEFSTAGALSFTADQKTKVLRPEENQRITGFYGCFYPTRPVQHEFPSLSSFGILTSPISPTTSYTPVPHPHPRPLTDPTLTITNHVTFPKHLTNTDLFRHGIEQWIYYSDLALLNQPTGTFRAVRGFVLTRDTKLRKKGSGTGICLYPRKDEEYPLMLGQALDAEGGTVYELDPDEELLLLRLWFVERTGPRPFSTFRYQLRKIALGTSRRWLEWGEEPEPGKDDVKGEVDVQDLEIEKLMDVPGEGKLVWDFGEVFDQLVTIDINQSERDEMRGPDTTRDIYDL